MKKASLILFLILSIQQVSANQSSCTISIDGIINSKLLPLSDCEGQESIQTSIWPRKEKVATVVGNKGELIEEE